MSTYLELFPVCVLSFAAYIELYSWSIVTYSPLLTIESDNKTLITCDVMTISPLGSKMAMPC